MHMRYRYFTCQYTWGKGISCANTRKVQVFHVPIHVRYRYFTCKYSWCLGVSRANNTHEVQVFYMQIHVNYMYITSQWMWITGISHANAGISQANARVAKGHQELPRVSKVQGEPQGWLRWVRTKSIIQGIFFNWCFPKIHKYGKKLKYQNLHDHIHHLPNLFVALSLLMVALSSAMMATSLVMDFSKNA